MGHRPAGAAVNDQRIDTIADALTVLRDSIQISHAAAMTAEMRMRRLERNVKWLYFMQPAVFAAGFIIGKLA